MYDYSHQWDSSNADQGDQNSWDQYGVGGGGGQNYPERYPPLRPGPPGGPFGWGGPDGSSAWFPPPWNAGGGYRPPPPMGPNSNAFRRNSGGGYGMRPPPPGAPFDYSAPPPQQDPYQSAGAGYPYATDESEDGGSEQQQHYDDAYEASSTTSTTAAAAELTQADIEQSEANLKAQYDTLMTRQQSEIEEFVFHSREQAVRKRGVELNLTWDQMNEVCVLRRFCVFSMCRPWSDKLCFSGRFKLENVGIKGDTFRLFHRVEVSCYTF